MHSSTGNRPAYQRNSEIRHASVPRLGATKFAQSCGGGSSDNSLPWGRKEDEEDRRFAYRCMMQAHKMLKPAQPKRGMGGRR